MSHEYYDKKLAEQIEELEKLKEMEVEPMGNGFEEWKDPEADDAPEEDDKPKTSKKLPTQDFHCQALFEHHVELYVRYLQIYRAVTECYDQVIHPQKGQIISKLLLEIVTRMLDHRVHLIHTSKDPGCSNHIPITDTLVKLGLPVSSLSVPVPRFILEENVCQPEPLSIMHKVFNKSRAANELVVPAPPSIRPAEPPPLSLEMAFETFAKVERWRQHRDVATVKIGMVFENSNRDVGKVAQTQAALNIQKHWKGFQVRKEMKKEIEEDLAFLGLKELTTEQAGMVEDLTFSSILKESPNEDNNIQRRRKLRLDRLNDFRRDAIDVKEEIARDEYEFLKQEKKSKMWEFLQWRREVTGEWDKEIKGYSDDYIAKYEEELRKKAEEPEEEDAKDSKKKDAGKKDKKGDKKKKKPKKKAKKKKGKKGKGDEMSAIFARGADSITFKDPQKRLEPLGKEVSDFPQRWEPFANPENVAQTHNVEVIRKAEIDELSKQAETEAKKEVQQQLNQVRRQLGLPVAEPKGKGKKKKGGKKKKSKKKK